LIAPEDEMSTYTPTPDKLTTIPLPEDGVTPLVAESVNTPFAEVADGVEYLNVRCSDNATVLSVTAETLSFEDKLHLSIDSGPGTLNGSNTAWTPPLSGEYLVIVEVFASLPDVTSSPFTWLGGIEINTNPIGTDIRVGIARGYIPAEDDTLVTTIAGSAVVRMASPFQINFEVTRVLGLVTAVSTVPSIRIIRLGDI
jgi:hypothetical protein